MTAHNRAEDMRTSYADGESPVTIARRHNVSRSTVYGSVARNWDGTLQNPHGPNTKIPPEDWPQIRDARANGTTVNDLAAQYGVAPETMSRYFTRQRKRQRAEEQALQDELEEPGKTPRPSQQS